VKYNSGRMQLSPTYQRRHFSDTRMGTSRVIWACKKGVEGEKEVGHCLGEEKGESTLGGLGEKITKRGGQRQLRWKNEGGGGGYSNRRRRMRALRPAMRKGTLRNIVLGLSTCAATRDNPHQKRWARESTCVRLVTVTMTTTGSRGLSGGENASGRENTLYSAVIGPTLTMSLIPNEICRVCIWKKYRCRLAFLVSPQNGESLSSPLSNKTPRDTGPKNHVLRMRGQPRNT